MSLKGINPIEQHFEKGIAGVFALGLLGVLAWQFLAKPNSVKVGNDEVRLDEAYSKVATAATQTRAKLDAVNVPKPEGGDAAAGTIGQFEARYKGPVAPQKQLATAMDRVPPPVGGGVTDSGVQTKLAGLDVPAPAKPLGATFVGTIDPSEPQQHPEVANVLPKQEPYDKASATIESTFDGAALKALLSKDPGGGVGPIPKNWWDGAVQIVGVELIRQVQKPDKTWGPDEVVPAMPGRQAFASPVEQINSIVALRDAVRIATDNAQAVRRPEYYRIRLGDKWMSPTDLKAQLDKGEPGTDDIARLKARLEREKKALKTIEDNLAKAPQAPPPGAPPAGGGGGGGGGGRGGSGGGGAPGGGGGPPPPTAPSGDRQMLQRLRDNKLKEIAAIEKSLRDAGENVGQAPQDANQPPVKPKATETALLDNPAVRVWAHDVFAQRGQTYRYKMVVLISNPFFGHAAAMLPEQASLAKSPVQRSAASEWSDPVHIEPETYWFITAASEAGKGLNAVAQTASAKAEVYQFKWGYWRRGSVTLEPGDSIEAEIKIPDMSKVVSKAMNDQPPQLPPGDPGNGPGFGGGPGGGGRGGRGAGGAGGGPGGAGGGAGAPPPRTPPPAGGGDLAKGEPIPVSVVQVSSPSVMLDVASTPTPLKGDENARSGVLEQVFLRDDAGVVVVRLPRDERESPEYQRVSRSADRGDEDVKSHAPPKAGTPPATPPGQGTGTGGRDR